MVITNKTRRCNNARFLENTLKKTLSSGKSLISTYSFFCFQGGKGKGGRVGAYLSLRRKKRGGRLFEAGRLLTFSALRMGAYSRRALIRGWALI